ncbi:hypothetical protein MTR_1g069865 [Medicago truncatula]|uniref:Uncharacterized protein n=1 Tax=Medicago truncatula TaxID=3880 RepID=A0A072VKH6_MEDTR|nr:hypothetical protein MTR_1g069865 [Medicago truncatula]
MFSWNQLKLKSNSRDRDIVQWLEHFSVCIYVIKGEENFDIVPCGVQSMHQGVRLIVMYIKVDQVLVELYFGGSSDVFGLFFNEASVFYLKLWCMARCIGVPDSNCEHRCCLSSEKRNVPTEERRETCQQKREENVNLDERKTGVNWKRACLWGVGFLFLRMMLKKGEEDEEKLGVYGDLFVLFESTFAWINQAIKAYTRIMSKKDLRGYLKHHSGNSYKIVRSGLAHVG